MERTNLHRSERRPQVTRILSTLSLIVWPALVALTVVASGCNGTGTGPNVIATIGSPTCHADPWQACAAMLAESFPDDDAWTVLECGAAGVVATDVRGETYAVVPDGSIYHVDEACGWTLIASDETRKGAP